MSEFHLPRFYPILDTRSLAAAGIQPQDAAQALLDAGIKILQYRHKPAWTQAAFDEAAEIARMADDAGSLFVINDRVDYARLLGAAVHLGTEDLSPFAARRILGADPVVGFSTHNGRQLKDADEEQVQYLALGPIFSTGSKENPDPVVGLERLRKWRPLTSKPVVAIGGITIENATDVLNAGADSVAVISGYIPTEGGLSALRQSVNAWISRTERS